ncbi:MAG: cupredoxin domain-containing protein, partial [Actinobacteria bacterium]|nr:cupredoxin domain-containing protein [Actinomycetota bacterium]MCA1683967.1 cupredoxin domain-containing protein [Actinomycetota bacterium]
MVAYATAGCSNGDDFQGTELATLDFRFEPAEFLATAGQQVTLTVVNKGEATHNLSIPSLS